MQRFLFSKCFTYYLCGIYFGIIYSTRKKILPVIKENRFEIYGGDNEDWDKVLNEPLD